MKAFDFAKIDWSELRNQKAILLNVIDQQLVGTPETEALTGILHLIDSIQDYAVDEMEMNANDVFDLELEDTDFNPNF